MLKNLNHGVIPEVKSVSRLGWIEDYGFSPYVDGVIFDGDHNYQALFKSVKTQGDRQEWMNMLEIRGGSIAGRIMLCIS